MATTKLTIPIEIELDDEFFSDLLVTALEGGSNYWIDHITVRIPSNQQKPQGMSHSEWAGIAINNYGNIKVTSTEGDNVITKGSLINGIMLWVSHHPSHVSFEGDTIDSSNIDASDADSILQYAVFGKLVFG